MAELTVVYSSETDQSWLALIKAALKDMGLELSFWKTQRLAEETSLSGRRFLFVCDLNEIGRDKGIDELLISWKKRQARGERRLLAGVYAAIISRSMTDWHTKTHARSLALFLSDLGASVIGKPLIEVLPNYENFRTWKKTSSLSLEGIGLERIQDLARRLSETALPKLKAPRILVLHTCDYRTSNTLALWHLTRQHLESLTSACQIHEIYMPRGSITDCISCPYNVCVGLAKELDCTVGGQYVEEIMPHMAAADVILWLCPNYNDTLSADLISVINRMSGFYRTRDLTEKRIYGIIVSGNSGTDAVANQLIGSLNLNKGFALPPHFCLTEIANDPLSVLEKPGISEKARAFAQQICREICE